MTKEASYTPGQLRFLERMNVTLAERRMRDAAPEMFEALEKLDDFWTERFPEGPDGNPDKGIFTLSDETLDIWRAIRAALARYALSECSTSTAPDEADENEAAAQALAFARPKLVALKNEKGLIGVWCHAFRIGWSSANRAALSKAKGE